MIALKHATAATVEALADARTLPRFTNTAIGITQYLPQGSTIVLGPNGRNVDVMAHELAHAEMLSRIGYRTTLFCVPTWFDEGLAVQFDERAFYSEQAYAHRFAEGWRLPAFAELATAHAFFAGTRERIRFHYAGARIAVSKWLRARAREGTRPVDTIRCGEAWNAELERIAVMPEVAVDQR